LSARLTGGISPAAVGLAYADWAFYLAASPRKLTDREAKVRAGLKAGEQVAIFPSDRAKSGVRIRAGAGG